MNISDAIKARYNSVLSDIPRAVSERLIYLKTNRLGSNFDKHGAVSHIIELGELHVQKAAVGLLRATYVNPYLTDQEKIECLMEDGPEIYVMEACIELAEAYELQLERIGERKAYDKENQKNKKDFKKLVRARTFATFLHSALDWVTPTTVHEAVMHAKKRTAVARNPSVSSFIDSLTVSVLKQKMEEAIKYAEKTGNLNILSKTPQKIMYDIMDGIIKDCQHKTSRSGGIGSPVQSISDSSQIIRVVLA